MGPEKQVQIIEVEIIKVWSITMTILITSDIYRWVPEDTVKLWLMFGILKKSVEMTINFGAKFLEQTVKGYIIYAKYFLGTGLTINKC